MPTLTSTIHPRLVAKLGEDHVAYILSCARPIDVCRSRATGQWDCNEPESYAAYHAIGDIIADENGGTYPDRTIMYGADWYRYFRGTSDVMGRGWGENV